MPSRRISGGGPLGGTVMRNGWRGVFVVGLECVAVSMGMAWAGGGLIRFSGAVVTPTCGIGESVQLPGEVGGAGVISSCGSPVASGGGGQVANPSIYRREVIRLDGHENLPLLRQFSDQAAAASSTGRRPLLVVQTYE